MKRSFLSLAVLIAALAFASSCTTIQPISVQEFVATSPENEASGYFACTIGLSRSSQIPTSDLVLKLMSKKTGAEYNLSFRLPGDIKDLYGKKYGYFPAVVKLPVGDYTVIAGQLSVPAHRKGRYEYMAMRMDLNFVDRLKEVSITKDEVRHYFILELDLQQSYSNDNSHGFYFHKTDTYFQRPHNKIWDEWLKTFENPTKFYLSRDNNQKELGWTPWVLK